jgi:hypothetical protein
LSAPLRLGLLSGIRQSLRTPHRPGLPLKWQAA